MCPLSPLCGHIINTKDCTVKRMDGSSLGSPQSVFKHQQRLIHLLKEVEEALVTGNLLGGVHERVLLLIREGGGAPGDEIFERIKMGFDGSVNGKKRVSVEFGNICHCCPPNLTYSWSST